MGKPLAVVGAAIVSFGLGMVVAGSMGTPGSEDEAMPPPLDIPLALQRPWLLPISEYDTFRADNDGEPFDDAQVDRMLATLAAILSLPDVAADIEHQADFAFGRFNSQLQTGRINEELTARIGAYLDELKEERLDYRTWWDGHSRPDADVVAADGPIAAEWGVFEWRKIYVLDEEGVIRHVDKRGGALIAAVDELLLKKRMREYEAQREAAAEPEYADGEADEGAEPRDGTN